MRRTWICISALLLALPWATEAGQNRERNRHRCSLAGFLPDLPYGEMSTDEIDDLTFMREEEKLARDVYLTLHEEFDLKVFRQIAKSEKTHMRAVLYHLRKYDLVDPAAGNGVGVFTNPGLQQLYHDLILLGMLSREEALEVGATIEELDIRDLRLALGRTDNVDLRTLYQNLLKGSRNHLRTFHKHLISLGIQYQPQYLEWNYFHEIVASPKERGVVDADGEYLCGGRGQSIGSG